MWLCKSYQEFSREAAGVAPAMWEEIAPDCRTRLSPTDGKGPPVIVAECGELPQQYPILEGRHRQLLPRIPGRIPGRLLAGNTGSEQFSGEKLQAWLVPWRVGTDRTMVITLKPGTVLVLDVTAWQRPQDDRRRDGQARRPRVILLRRAGRVLSAAPRAFATEPSIGAAYDRLERIWNDQRLEEGDPQGELLARQARQLRAVLEDLAKRPRAVLRTEHRMLKLQTVHRTDAKTLRWLSAQPGRNTAERAGARQRIKAPKRYETIATLENRVLRAFAALTVLETKGWLANRVSVPDMDGARKAIIEAHQLRARRIEGILREREVPEARPPVQPNFPLRFDPRYREIWRAWLELRERSTAAELEWMWQHRTFMELLGLRAAMKLHQAIHDRADNGILAHGPVIRTIDAPNQGCYLQDAGIRSTLGIASNSSLRVIEYRINDDGGLLGAIAAAGPRCNIWWDAQDLYIDNDGSVGELPWDRAHAWDTRLEKWAAKVTS